MINRLARRAPAYKGNPPAKQEIARPDGTPLANVKKMLDELRID